ncbi:GNAT family N-acetyltransferase [Endozoicomonadaceae bacterium StTr2]
MRVISENSKNRFRIETMTRQEAEQMILWEQQEGWNPGLYDAATFYAANSNGLFAGRLNSRMIGCGSVLAYDDDFAFFGLYIVAREFRSQGYGMAITRRRREYAGDRIIGLDGVISNVAAYSSAGFKAAYRTRRFHLEQEVSDLSISIEDMDIVPFRPDLLDQIASFDERFFPAWRREFLAVWLSQRDAIVQVALCGHTVIGYIVLRPCVEGAKVGPLFADSPVVARALLIRAAQLLGRYPVMIDMPEVNNSGLTLAAELNMKLVWETLRMYTRTPREIELGGIYGLTNLETG